MNQSELKSILDKCESFNSLLLTIDCFYGKLRNQRGFMKSYLEDWIIKNKHKDIHFTIHCTIKQIVDCGWNRDMIDYANKSYSLGNIREARSYYMNSLNDHVLCIVPEPQDASRFAYPISWIVDIEYDKNIFEEDTVV